MRGVDHEPLCLCENYCLQSQLMETFGVRFANSYDEELPRWEEPPAPEIRYTDSVAVSAAGLFSDALARLQRRVNDAHSSRGQ